MFDPIIVVCLGTGHWPSIIFRRFDTQQENISSGANVVLR